MGFEKELSHAKAEHEHRVEQQDSKMRKMMVAINRMRLHGNSAAALKKLQKTSQQMIILAMRREEKIITSEQFTAAKKLHNALQKLTVRLVRQLMAQFEKKLSHAKAEREQRVEQQDTWVRKLTAAIDRIGSHVNSSAALKKFQKEVKAMEKKEVKAMEKRLTHLRRAKEIEALNGNKWIRSAIAVLKRGEKQTSKQMISLAMRKEEKIIKLRQSTAAKKLHTELKELTGRLVRQLIAQFEKELSHAKAEREHRVEQQHSKLRKLMVAIDRIGSHVNFGAALKNLQNEVKAIEKKEGLTHLRRAKDIEALERNEWVKSAIAVLKREERQGSKQMISLVMRKEAKIITSKKLTAAKKLHTALKALTGRLVR